MTTTIGLILSFCLAQLAWAQTPAAPVEAPAVAASVTPEWKPKYDWSGDIRYRLATFKESVDDERKYQQLRVRLGIRADVNEKVQAVIRLATATSAVSSNQTVGDSSDPGSARRGFGLDLSYIDARPWDDVYLWAGRTANPFWSPAKVQTLFDADLAFEGFAAKYEPKTGFFANLGAFMISENFAAPTDSVDTGHVGADAGAKLKFGNSSLGFHAGNHYFFNVQNANITRMDKDAKVDPYSYPFDRYKGNTVRVNDPLLPADQRKYFFQTEFVLLQAGVEWKQTFGKFEYTLFGEAIRNDKVGQLGRAFEYGAIVKWAWFTASYAWITKESDSVIGAFTDSDSNGGGTDNDGKRAGVGFQLARNTALNATYYFGQRGVDTVKRDFTSSQVDLVVNF
jgi:hypothetical protein